jgi:hypothetical protein
MALMGRREPVSPERLTLAEAIQAALDARRARDGALSTEGPAARSVKAAEDAAADARERLAGAKSSAADQAAADLRDGEVMEMPASLRAARSALVEAEDRLELARGVRDRLNSRRADLDSAVAGTAAEVATARDAVVRTEGGARVKALKAELIATQHRMMAIADELGWLIQAGAVPLVTEPGGRYNDALDEELRDALFRCATGNFPLHGKRLEDLVPQPAPSALWAAASTELERDAGAPLPGTGG